LFVDDSSVKNGECIVETNEGVVEYLIQEHLSQIESALLEMKTEIEQVK
jgi:flagellar biosynthesis/type III secretory pathway protein FliH